ncbi:hypothetical protein BDY17DRAFT_327908 [Neohortaea acidophila]|uniref:Stress-response A/B barrel domain-containing protein n=1 Tax=Neohortaea acidophila TaxID=245834 RepID=A0A6A6PIL8_9PEZI|nr:uncharacterized protein BDY17DRAFT_327908 [Neohortaea acidophila]KAF2479117.1 hypothetical protein BDY17DRAFT_327908 [Neohortaea acidophila]
MPIIHIVLFEFYPVTTHAQVEDVCTRMLALSQKCVHPITRQPYVKSYGGGRDNSPEGLQGAFTHGFVSEFQNQEDRKYYLEQDPEHLAFVATLKNVVMNVRVVDYEPGKF